MAQVHGVLHLPGRLGFTKEIWSKCVAYSGFKVSNVWPYKMERPVLSGKEWFDHFGCRKNKLWKSLVELLLYPSLAWLSDQDGHLDLFFSIDIYQCIFCKENMLGSKCSLHMCLFLCGLHKVDTCWTESRATSYWFRVLLIVGTLKAYPWENKWWKRLKLGKNLERNNRRGDESIREGGSLGTLSSCSVPENLPGKSLGQSSGQLFTKPEELGGCYRAVNPKVDPWLGRQALAFHD